MGKHIPMISSRALSINFLTAGKVNMYTKTCAFTNTHVDVHVYVCVIQMSETTSIMKRIKWARYTYMYILHVRHIQWTGLFSSVFELFTVPLSSTP